MSVDVAPATPAPPPAAATSVMPELTAALIEVAGRLEALAAHRAGLARAARVDWAGPHRVQFDAERANRDAQTAALVARCRRLARSQP